MICEERRDFDSSLSVVSKTFRQLDSPSRRMTQSTETPAEMHNPRAGQKDGRKIKDIFGCIGARRLAILRMNSDTRKQWPRPQGTRTEGTHRCDCSQRSLLLCHQIVTLHASKLSTALPTKIGDNLDGAGKEPHATPRGCCGPPLNHCS